MKLVRFPLVPMESSEMMEVKKRNLINEDQMKICFRFQTDDDFQAELMEKMIVQMAQREEEAGDNNATGKDNDEVDTYVFDIFQLNHYQLRRNQSNMSYISQRLMNNGDPSAQN